MNESIHAILCDLDGVITQTAKIHAESWKLLFDEFSEKYLRTNNKMLPHFDINIDYPGLIDGKPRLEGIRSYLNKLNISLPEGKEDDPSERISVLGLANRKNEIFNLLLKEKGVELYSSSIEQLKKWKLKGIRLAVVSSSKNCKKILEVAQIENFFDVVVDGLVAENKFLKGKPEPDTFLYAAKLLNVSPINSMVVEDSLAGIVAGRNGRFGTVTGIIHNHNEDDLYNSGADYAVKDLKELDIKISLLWRIVREGFNSYNERSTESILSFSNGYIGSRNSLEEDYSFSEQSTYVAGVYQEIAGTFHNELAKLPDWTKIQILLDGNIIDLFNYQVLDHKRHLDLKKGIVLREWRSQDTIGRIISIKITKYISLSNKYQAVKSISIIPENFSGTIKIISGIDGIHISSNILISDKEKLEMAVSTFGNSNTVIFFQESQFNSDKFLYKKTTEEKRIFEEWQWTSELGKEYTINSLVTIYSDLDYDKKNFFNDSYNTINNSFFQNCLNNHIQSWAKRWKNSEVVITGDPKAQVWVNFALYHLISSGEYTGNNTSIGARSLTGTSYQGHIFWDTEMYLLPFYIFTAPQIAKALLMYRYNTLNGARENSKREGEKGACFAWESTDSGIEMAPIERVAPYGQILPNYTSFYEIHITPDIAYAVWQYHNVTQDIDFLLNYGAEIIYETARFCEFLLTKENDGLYHIKDVVGPDEYHERIDDNVYTNFMALNNFDIALELDEVLRRDYPDNYEILKNKIGIKEEEIVQWKEVKDKIYTGFNPSTRTYEQFKGFFELEYIDLKKYEPRRVPMDMLLGERIKRTQVIKQADVLMLQFLLARKFSKEVIEANYNYYEPRTSHGSSLSPSIHCIIAARLGKLNDAYRYFEKNGGLDLDDKFGNAAGGVHIASMGGTWLSIVMGFAGLYIYENGLLFDPHLPDQWKKVQFSIVWRGQKLSIMLRKDEVVFVVKGNKAINISIGYNNWRELFPDNNYSATSRNKIWKWEN